MRRTFKKRLTNRARLWQDTARIQVE